MMDRRRLARLLQFTQFVKRTSRHVRTAQCPLQVQGDTVYSSSGAVVSRINGGKVFGPDGRYVGTITGDRLVYRSTDSAGIGSPFAAARSAGSGQARPAGSGDWGDEPKIPD